MYSLKRNLILAARNGNKDCVTLIINKLRSEFLELREELLNKDVIVDFWYGEKNIIRFKASGGHTPKEIITKYKTEIEGMIGVTKDHVLVYCNENGLGLTSPLYIYNKDIISIYISLKNEDSSMPYIKVKSFTGNRVETIQYDPDEKILFFKKRYEDHTNLPIRYQQLYFKCTLLENTNTIRDYNIQSDDFISLFIRMRGGMFQITSGLVDYNAVKGYISDISKLDVLISDIKSRLKTDFGGLNDILLQLNLNFLRHID
jgi:hypothetical protein